MSCQLVLLSPAEKKLAQVILLLFLPSLLPLQIEDGGGGGRRGVAIQLTA
jgi:hypothetical protein